MVWLQDKDWSRIKSQGMNTNVFAENYSTSFFFFFLLPPTNIRPVPPLSLSLPLSLFLGIESSHLLILFIRPQSQASLTWEGVEKEEREGKGVVIGLSNQYFWKNEEKGESMCDQGRREYKGLYISLRTGASKNAFWSKKKWDNRMTLVWDRKRGQEKGE